VSAVSRALNRAAQSLAATSDTPRLDAELLMAAAFGIGRDQLLLRPPPGPVPDGFEAMVERRKAREPVAYITGHREFWTIDLEVGPGALIPRPDSETLLVAAVEHFAGTPGPKRVLDLGTGPGTLLLAALDQWPAATGLGVDSSLDALAYAHRNARRLGLLDRAGFANGDWATGIAEQFDLILCNPPYVADDAPLASDVADYEPDEALFGGADGLDDYRRLAPGLARLMAPGGLAVIEIGFDQGDQVRSLLETCGLQPTLLHDLAGHPRALAVRR